MKRTMIILAAVCTMAACQKSAKIEVPGEMTFEAIYPGAETKATDTAFEAGDEIGVFVVEYEGDNPGTLQFAGNYATNIKGSYDGSVWTTAPKVLWENGKYDFYAYYPYLTKVNSVDELEFAVQTDQTGDGMTLSDFMLAKTAGVSATTEKIPLQFAHKLSKIRVILTKGPDYTGDLPETHDLYIHNVNHNAIIDLSSGAVVCNSRKQAVTIKSHQVSATEHEAIIIPQRLNNRVPLIELVTNGVSYMVESRFLFKSGVCHTFNLILSDNPEQIKIEVGGEIKDWN